MMTLDQMLLDYQRTFAASPKKRKMWISSRQIGKSFTLAYLAAQRVLTSRRGAQALALVISTGARAASEFLKKCEQMAAAVSILEPSIMYSASADCVKFSTGGRILSLPSGNPSSLRGYTADIVIVDEGAYIDHLEDVLAAIAPTLTRNKDAELVIATTPAGKNGYFYEMYQEALDDDRWHVQHTTVYEAAAAGLEVDLEALRSLCPDPDVFAQEYECKFAAEFGSMLDPSLLVFEDRPKCEGLASFAGVDIGATSDRTAIADVVQTGECEYFVKDIVMLHKADYQHQLEVLRDLHAQRQWSSGYIDANGIGNPIAEFASKQVSARMKGYTWTASNKTAAYENLRALVFDRKIVFAEHLRQLLTRDIQNVSRVVSEAGQVKYTAGRNENGHSDSVSALVLALMAAKEMPHGAAEPVSYQRVSPFGAWRSRLV